MRRRTVSETSKVRVEKHIYNLDSGNEQRGRADTVPLVPARHAIPSVWHPNILILPRGNARCWAMVCHGMFLSLGS